jgi:hypothetical protein
MLITSFVLTWYNLTAVTRRFQRNSWNDTMGDVRDPLAREVVAELVHTSTQANATVYSGFTPFVGSGIEFHRWAGAIEVRPIDEVDGIAREGISLDPPSGGGWGWVLLAGVAGPLWLSGSP